MSGRPKVELEIDPAKVVPMEEAPYVFHSRADHRGPYSPATRLIVYVVEDVDGFEAELVFVGHAHRGDTLTVTRNSGD